MSRVLPIAAVLIGLIGLLALRHCRDQRCQANPIFFLQGTAADCATRGTP